MSKIYVLLGKMGDLIACLPVFHMEHQKTGEKTRVMVSRQYASVFDGVSYVEPLIHEGPAFELEQAFARARTMGDAVSLQIAGEPAVVKKTTFIAQEKPVTGSFVKEFYHLAGMDGLWETQPKPLFDRRDSKRETELYAPFKPDYRSQWKTILVAVDGKNAPFPYKPLLMELLRLRFKSRWRVIDLSEVKADRIYDLLVLYEKADFLIASDSAPLHLGYAVPTLPVLALVNEKPLLWNGSPWRSQHVFHCRYSSFPTRAVEMMDTISNATDAGMPFGVRRDGVNLVHVWSQYEEREISSHRRWEARESWRREYASGLWISTPIEVGVFGRDTRIRFREAKPFPFLKDVLRLACLRARGSDIIVLTRCDTCFSEGLTRSLLESPLAWSHRAIFTGEGLTHHPAVDLFAFTREFWQAHEKELPDLVMGLDFAWHRVLVEWLKRAGAKELNMEVWRKAA